MLARFSGRAAICARPFGYNDASHHSGLRKAVLEASRDRSIKSWCKQPLQNSRSWSGQCFRSCQTQASPSRWSPVARLSARHLAGGGLLFGSAGLATWCRRGAEVSAIKCEEPAPAEVKVTRQEGPVKTIIGMVGALSAWSVLVAIWAGAITMPFVLLAAIALSKWRLASALGVLFAVPHLVRVPRLGLLRHQLFFGIKRWFGPAPMCRVIDLRSSARDEPDPEPEPGNDSRKQLICFHPHGIYSLGLMTVLEEKPEVRVMSSAYLYHCAPSFRLVADLLLGIKMGSVGRTDLAKTMKAGDGPLMMVPGGFHEATISCPGHERVFLKNRRGFVKYALRYGYDLVPCYSIGESDLMANPQGGWKWRFLLNGFSIPAVLPWGHWLFPLLPRRGVQLVTAIGPPVKLPHIPNPSDEDVKEHHARYMTALQELYSKAKVGTASEGRPLEVW